MTAPAPRRGGYLRLLADREFRALFLSHLLSLLGDRVAAVAISVLVFARSGSVVLTAAAYATSLLPWLLGAPFLASLSDRWPRRRVMLSCDVVRAVLVCALATPGLPIGWLLLLLTLVSTLGPPFESARAATLPVLLPAEDDFLAGSSLTMISNQASQVLGLAAGGVLVSLVTTRQALLIDAASFVASALLLAVLLRPRPAAVAGEGEHAGVWSSTVAGARYVFTERQLRVWLLLAWLVAAFTVLPEGVAVALAADRGAPKYAVGLLMAAVPVGAAYAAWLLARTTTARRDMAVVPLGYLAMLGLAATPLARNWQVVLVLWVLVGIGSGVQLPISASYMRTVPDAFRSRAFGLAQTGLMAGQALALLVAGAGAELVGVRPALLMAGLLGLLPLTLLARAMPRQLPSFALSALRRYATESTPVDRWIVTVTVVAVLCVVGVWQEIPPREASIVLSPWVLGAVFFATGSFVANIRVGRQIHAFQLDDIPRLVGLIFLPPGALVLSRLGGAAAALFVMRKQRGRKLLFNLASFGVEVSVAIAVFHLLDTGHGVGPAIWPAALVATVVADLVSAVTVGVVIGLSEGHVDMVKVLRPDRMALGTAVGAATLGMIAATTLWFQPSAAILILLLTLLAMAAQRGFARLVRDADEQQRLQAALAAMSTLDATRESLMVSLEQIRALLDVEAVQCRLPPTTLGWRADDLAQPPLEVHAPQSRVDLEALGAGGVSAQAAQAAQARTMAAPEVSARRQLLWRRRWDTAPLLAAPLPAEGEAGALVVAHPVDPSRVFGRDDVALLESVAGFLAAAIQRVEHRERLFLDATSDRLTGLANRTEFGEQLRRLVETGEQRVAVLTINLRRLRAVNDVFGRDVGDSAIVSSANRARALAPTAALLGRVSGHHLACAFPYRLPSQAVRIARELRSQLELPLQEGELQAELGVQIGIALAPAHGRDTEGLLRRSETAADEAENDPFGVRVFDPESERDAARPLQLVTDLRAALQRKDITQLHVHFQPKQSVARGGVTGHEALLRWEHPTLGTISPDEFIALAESAGLIGLLTRFVLDRALKQARQWRDLELPCNVAVNLSARSLHDPTLVPQVQEALRRNGLPSEVLTLELTETSVMANPTLGIVVLNALDALGVTLSVDDFGTGYSNLAYLRELPVKEVKLDRTFLASARPGGHWSTRELDFLQHAIGLVHSLGLTVVAEGVEDRATLSALAALGADTVQGYFICRPRNGSDITTWMRERPQPVPAAG